MAVESFFAVVLLPRLLPEPFFAVDVLAVFVAALESAVADLQGGSRSLPSAPRGHAHPSLQVLGPGGGGDRCLMEPDKPCVQSHACRTFGH